jgi:peptidoglycan hydrolase CwlO-like protein
MAREIERLADEIRRWSQRRASNSSSRLDYISQISRRMSPAQTRNLDAGDQLDDKQAGLSALRESTSSIQSGINLANSSAETTSEHATSAQSQVADLSENASALDSSLVDTRNRVGQIRARFTS